ncbi:MAG: hypothetical protein WCP97_08575 [bacterium]
MVKPFRYTLFVAGIVNLIIPIIYCCYSIIGRPSPEYITHGWLWAALINEVMSFSLYGMFALLVLIFIQGFILWFVRKRASFCLIGLGFTYLQFFWICVNIFLFASAVIT